MPVPSAAPPSPSHGLVRTMGLCSLTIYGVGDMLGSGIYALVGKAAGMMGNAVWLAFLASMVAALLTGLSYATLGSRYPRAAGAAYVTQRAFGWPFLSYLVGLAVMASGLTSMATASRAFGGYLHDLVAALPVTPIIVGFILVLTFFNFYGMRQSTWLNILCTTVEVGGLGFIVVIGLRYWGGIDYFEVPDRPDVSGLTATLVLNGAVLTFFSFVGFEDMLNVTEEVKDPRRMFPIALILALLIVTLIYMVVSITAVSVVPYETLAASGGPLVEVVRRAAPRFPPGVFTAVSMFAITNTALLNYIMGSRLVYGMAKQGLLPHALARVHPTRRTPHVAILVIMCIVLTLAFVGDIASLGKATAVLLLGAFMLMNGALVILKHRPGEPKGAFEVPILVPIGGLLVCALLIVHARRAELLIAGSILIGIVILYFITRPKVVVEPPEPANDI